jgi:hypothetical protein
MLVYGTKMKVELQDNSRRRKGPDEARTSTRNDGCFVCGKPGHIAKNCRENRGNCLLKQSVRSAGGEALLLRCKERRKSAVVAVRAVLAGGRAGTRRSAAARLRNPSTKSREDTALQAPLDSNQWPYQ